MREQLALQTGIPLNFSSDPTTAVAVGAAYYAANKYFEAPGTEDQVPWHEVDEKTDGDFVVKPVDLKIELSYNKSSRDKEEVVLLFCEGDYENKFFRIIRSDGGFDTGFVSLKAKKPSFLH